MLLLGPPERFIQAFLVMHKLQLRTGYGPEVSRLSRAERLLHSTLGLTQHFYTDIGIGAGRLACSSAGKVPCHSSPCALPAGSAAGAAEEGNASCMLCF